MGSDLLLQSFAPTQQQQSLEASACAACTPLLDPTQQLLLFVCVVGVLAHPLSILVCLHCAVSRLVCGRMLVGDLFLWSAWATAPAHFAGGTHIMAGAKTTTGMHPACRISPVCGLCFFCHFVVAMA